MENYEPPFEITPLILGLTSAISIKVGQIINTTKKSKQIHPRRNNKIKSIHASLKIEANSLSFEQVSDIINGKVVIGPQNEIQEVKNAYNA